MTPTPPSFSSSLEQLVITLVPSLSKSLAERFNVLRVMHHGTHEKQISNVFAWLLQIDGTHGLRDVFQRIFVEQVNRALPEESQIPITGYRVDQEVNTSGRDAPGKDIADIVLSSERTTIVVENFESSDGHGHDYGNYTAYGAAGGKRSVVVLMCIRRELHRQSDGWEQAIVVTYADLLESLRAHVESNKAWRHTHQDQHFFLRHLFEHFLGGAESMSQKERIAFIKSMCETGESARYGHRPHEVATQEFAELVAQHAKRQFEEGRKTLSQVKKALKRYADQTLVVQLNGALMTKEFAKVETRFVGQWEWCVTLNRVDSKPAIFLEFGPTAVVENSRVPEPLTKPDYTKLFVTRQAIEFDGIDFICQTDVGLADVLDGLPVDDTRLLESVLRAVHAS